MNRISGISEKEHALLGDDYCNTHDVRLNPGQRSGQDFLQGVIKLDKPLSEDDFMTLMDEESALMYIDKGTEPAPNGIDVIDKGSIAAHIDDDHIEWDFLASDGIGMDEIEGLMNKLGDMGYTPSGVFLIEDDFCATNLMIMDGFRFDTLGNGLSFEKSTASFSPNYDDIAHTVYNTAYGRIKGISPIQHEEDETEL